MIAQRPRLFAMLETDLDPALLRLGSRVRCRLRELAGGVGFGEAFLVGYGLRNGTFNILHPNGYTKGWTIIGSAVDQAQFGTFLLFFAFARLLAFLIGPEILRAAFAVLGLFLSLSVDIAVRKANPDSPTIPIQDAIAAANLTILGLLIYRRARRGGA